MLGYIGSFLTEALLKEISVLELFGVDNLSNVRRPSIHPELKFTRLDLTDFQQTENYFRAHSFDIVIHLAAKIYVHDSFEESETYRLVNFTATQNLITICKQQQIRRFIFASSSTLYKAPTDFTQLTEQSEIHPLNPYGQTKLDCEKLFLKNADYLKGYIFRFFNVAGAEINGNNGQDSLTPKHVIDRMSTQFAYKKYQFTLFGQNLATPDGTVVRDFVHVIDVASLLVKAIQKIQSENTVQIFNCGSGVGTSLKQLVLTFTQLIGENIEIEWGPYHQGDPLYSVSNSLRTQAYFDWQAKHSDIKQIIQSAYSWSVTIRSR